MMFRFDAKMGRYYGHDPKQRDMEMVITFLGGTGRLGQALVARFSRAGFRTIVGSRAPSRGQTIASELNQRVNPVYCIESYDYAKAVEKADIIFMTIPFPESRDIALSLAHKLQYKILVDTSVPRSIYRHTEYPYDPRW